jgi:hypothetical protein
MSNQAIEVLDQGAKAMVAPWDAEAILIRSTLPPEDTIRIKSQAVRLETIGDKPIMISDVICHMVEMPDKDGVMQDVVRTILVTPEGKGYAAMSKGVNDSLRDFCYMRKSKPTWNPPVKAQLVITRRANGHILYQLVPPK